MKFLVILSVCIVSAFCAAIEEDAKSAAASLRELPALEHEVKQDETGEYTLRYVTAEGTVVSERGRLIPTPDGTGQVLITEGEVSYVGDDGKTYVTKYTAGLDGFKAEGNHIPEPAKAEEPASDA